jgi:hypothetical protein
MRMPGAVHNFGSERKLALILRLKKRENALFRFALPSSEQPGFYIQRSWEEITAA